ncbi:MAG: hypothetical protein GYB65_10185 [Chloroflexi bacterium]|nr:hypothetical protein [Chloroflexota bacterium]
MSLFAVAPGWADDGSGLEVITPENVDQVRELRILRDVAAWDVAWSPSGQQLAVGTVNGVLLCQCDSFESPEMLSGLEEINAHRVAWSPDGRLLAAGTAGVPAQVYLRDMTDGSVRSVEVAAEVLSLTFSPTGEMFAVGLGRQEGVVVFDTATLARMGGAPAEIGVEAVVFTPDGQEVIYPSARELLRRQPVGDQPAIDLPVPCTITDLAVSDDGTRLVAATFDCCVNVFDLTSGEQLYRAVCGQTFTLDFSLDSRMFATGNLDGTIQFLSAEDGAYLATLNAHRDEITRLAFHPDGTRIVTVGLDDTVRVFGIPPEPVLDAPCDGAAVPEGEPAGEILYQVRPISGGPGSVYSVQAWCGAQEKLLDGVLYPAWSPDGTQFAFQYVNSDSGDFDGLWLADADGSNLRQVPNTQPQDRAPSWSPDGVSLVFESIRDGASGLYIVAVESGEVTPLVTSDMVTFSRPVWSPDGTQVAYVLREVLTDGDAGQVFVINQDGSNPRRVTDLEQVSSVAWSPDGMQLAASANLTPFSSSIVVIDVASSQYEELTQNTAYNLPVWSPDGNYIAFVHGNELVLMRSNGDDQRTLVRINDTFGSTGLSWKALDGASESEE